jgi:hypothetical protein
LQATRPGPAFRRSADAARASAGDDKPLGKGCYLHPACGEPRDQRARDGVPRGSDKFEQSLEKGFHHKPDKEFDHAVVGANSKL